MEPNVLSTSDPSRPSTAPTASGMSIAWISPAGSATPPTRQSDILMRAAWPRHVIPVTSRGFPIVDAKLLDEVPVDDRARSARIHAEREGTLSVDEDVGQRE